MPFMVKKTRTMKRNVPAQPGNMKSIKEDGEHPDPAGAPENAHVERAAGQATVLVRQRRNVLPDGPSFSFPPKAEGGERLAPSGGSYGCGAGGWGLAAWLFQSICDSSRVKDNASSAWLVRGSAIGPVSTTAYLALAKS